MFRTVTAPQPAPTCRRRHPAALPPCPHCGGEQFVHQDADDGPEVLCLDCPVSFTLADA